MIASNHSGHFFELNTVVVITKLCVFAGERPHYRCTDEANQKTWYVYEEDITHAPREPKHYQTRN